MVVLLLDLEKQRKGARIPEELLPMWYWDSDFLGATSVASAGSLRGHPGAGSEVLESLHTRLICYFRNKLPLPGEKALPKRCLGNPQVDKKKEGPLPSILQSP